MADAQSFKVGEAPWEQQASSPSASPGAFKVGEAPWETAQASAPSHNSISDNFQRMFHPTDDQAAADKQASLDGAKRQDAESTTSMDGTLNALTLDHYPQIKAKLGQIFSGEGFANDSDYVKRRDDEIASEKQMADQFPGAHATGKAAGYIIPMVATMGTGAPAVAAEATPGILAAAGRIGLQAGKGAVTGGAMGALGNPGDTPGVVDPLQLDARAKNAESGAKWGATIGGGISGVAESAPAIWNGGKWLGKKAVTTFLGPSGEAVDAYLANPSAIKNAPSVEDIKNGLDESMQHLFNGVDQAKINQADAKSALDHVQRQVRDVTSDANFKFRVQGADLKDQLAQAQSQLDDVFQAHKDRLASTPSPMQLAPHVEDAVQDLKNKVVQGSNESYGILDKDPNAYDVRGVADHLHQMADDMNVKGQKVVESEQPSSLGSLGGAPTKTTQLVSTDAAPVAGSAAQSKIRELANTIQNLPEQLPAPELKKIIQDLDTSGAASYGDPGFDSRTSAAYKMARAKIDQIIKGSNPEYAAKMAEVAPNADLLSQSLDRFGDPRAAQSKLNSIINPTASADKELLAKLGQATGRDFETPVSEYAAAQAKLKNPQAMADLKSSLPQADAVNQAQSLRDQLARPEAQPQHLEQALADQGGLRDKHAAAQKAFDDAQAALEDAKAKLEPYKSLTPQGTQGAVKSVMKPEDKENFFKRDALDALGKASGKDYLGDIQNSRLANQFAKDNTNGSRNAKMFGAAGSGLGYLVGHAPGALAGYSVGSQVGGAIDKFGPQIAMKVLDKGASVNNVVTALMKIPEMASLAESNPVGFKSVAMGIGAKIAAGKTPLSGVAQNQTPNSQDKESSMAPKPVMPAPQGVPGTPPLKGQDKWASDGHSNLMDHASDDQTKADLTDLKPSLMADPKAKNLMAQASDLKPGSKAMDQVLGKLKSRMSVVSK